MSDSNDPLKAMWRSQSTEVPAMSATYIRHRARELERGFRVRSLLEQGTSALGIVGCLVVLFVAPHPWVKAAAALLLAGVAYALIQWRRRTAALRIDPSDAVEAGVVFYKRELERKRDIHLTLWRWYLLPMAPGVIAILTWNFFGDPHTRGTAGPWGPLAMLVVCIVGSVIYERHKAAQCQREIDALASLESGTSATIQGSKR